MWWLMLGCVAFIVYCDAASANECQMRRICVLNTALDLAAAALCTEWGMGEATCGQHSVKCVTRSGGCLIWDGIRKEVTWSFGRWLGGFEWAIFVGADAFA